MQNNKKIVVYVRTTSKKQNHEIQLNAANPFVKDIPEEHLVYIVDNEVPSTSEREGLKQLLDLMSQDQVDTLIVYSRDRLTRSENEYQTILELIYSHGVKVVFTSKNTMPFNHDQKNGMLFESVFLQLINIEKANISNRIKAGLKRKQA